MKDQLDEDMQMALIGGDRVSRDVSAMLAMFGPAARLSPEVAGVPAGFASSPTPRRRGWYAAHGKHFLDVALVLLTAPMTLTVVAICALALWLEGGQPFYRQNRLGSNGRMFSILKLRTMVRDADSCLQRYLDADPELRHEWATTQKLKNDPRITRVGGLLRSTSLDELPQFWNVLKGDMSLVGPRPMMPDQLCLYGDPMAYFAVRPGVTGFWQVSARNESHFAFRAEIDAQYQRRMSLFCDLGVMLRTVGVMVRRTGY